MTTNVSQRTMNEVLPGYASLSEDDKETMLILYRNCAHKRRTPVVRAGYVEEQSATCSCAAWSASARYCSSPASQSVLASDVNVFGDILGSMTGELPFTPDMPCILLDLDGKPYAAIVEEASDPDDANLISLRVFPLDYALHATLSTHQRNRR